MCPFVSDPRTKHHFFSCPTFSEPRVESSTILLLRRLLTISSGELSLTLSFGRDGDAVAALSNQTRESELYA